MLKNIAIGIHRIWIAATLAMIVISLAMLCRAEPEAKSSGFIFLLANLAHGWLFFHGKAMQWLLRNWKLNDKSPRRILFDSLRVVGGMAFMTALVALGALILFAETCLPPFQLYLK